MITAILIDDEKIIRLGLRKMIQDHCPQIEVIGEAENGREALALTLSMDPDLCIVDMRMPYMSGIEYIAQSRRYGCRAKIVVLSGYADFTYAQQAIEQGCSGYLLKPVKVDQLTALLQNLCVQIQTEQAQHQMTVEACQQVFAHEQETVDRLCLQALTVGGEAISQLKEIHFLGEHNYWSALFRPVLEMLSFSASIPSAAYLEEMTRQLQYILRTVVGFEFYILVMPPTQLFLIAISSCEVHSASSAFPVVLEKAQQALTLAGLDSTTIGYSGPFLGEEELPESYRQCVQAVARQFYEGCDGIYEFCCDAFSDNAPAFRLEEKQFLNAMHGGDTAAAENALQAIFKLLHTNRTRKEVCVVIFSQLHLHLMRETVPKQDSIPHPTFAQVAEQLEEINTFAEMCDYVQALFLQQISAHREPSGTARRIVHNAIRYVENHYNTPLTVNEVAAYLGLSVSYFSTLFRRETGEKFISYLIQYKIDKACEMLEKSNLRVWEIGETLGYTDVKYFCKIFRKYSGCTPSEYRARIHSVAQKETRP